MKTNIRKAMVLWVALIGLIVTLPLNATALEPRLLWEKKLKFNVRTFEMASISGDVVISSRDARQIILYDKNGKEVFHWGPRVDRQPMGVEISDDGSVILYTTTFTESYLDQKKIAGDWDWDNRTHYSTRKGKELWNKKIWGSTELSPDGKLAVNYADGVEGKDINVYDSQGKILWTFQTNYVDALSFSPDSQYLGFHSMSHQSRTNGYYLMDKSGNMLWLKAEADAQYSTVSDLAKHVSIEPRIDENQIGKVYDKQGNLVFDGKAKLSMDGNRLLIPYPDRTVILSLPDKAVIKEYPFAVDDFLSQDGRFLVTLPTAGRNSVRVYDTMEDVSHDISLTGAYTSDNFLLRYTRDGKYMVIVVDGTDKNLYGNKILYYQLY